MPDKPAQLDTWLSLTDAAQRLGVHPTTLRRWADIGEIPMMLTPGGHRRFAARDVDQFADQRRHLRAEQLVSGIEQLWAEQAIDHTRQEIIAHRDEHWLQAFDDREREHKRALGRRLMGIILQYVSSQESGDALLEEARAIGREQAENVIRLGLPITIALKAAMFFRDSLVEAAVQLPATTHLRTEANIDLMRRINTVLNVVQLAIADAYDQSMPHPQTGTTSP